MVSVASLLNPIPSFTEERDQPPSPRYRTGCSSQPDSQYKKQKMSKDAAIFARGKVQGEVRYPPCEAQDEKLAIEHRRFSVYPMGQISEYRRHIPYNSEKKSFLAKTGRGAFEGTQSIRAILGASLADLVFSIPIHIQDPGRRPRLHCDVGL